MCACWLESAFIFFLVWICDDVVLDIVMRARVRLVCNCFNLFVLFVCVCECTLGCSGSGLAENTLVQFIVYLLFLFCFVNSQTQMAHTSVHTHTHMSLAH